jgi:hypothetical protein
MVGVANHSEGEEKPEMEIRRAGIDIAKSVFHVYAVDRHDRPQWQAKLKRGEWLGVLCERLAPGAEVGLQPRRLLSRTARPRIESVKS